MRLAGVAWRDLRLARDRDPVHKSREEDHAYHETSGAPRQHLRPRRHGGGLATCKGRDYCVQAVAGQNAGFYRLKVGAFEVTVLNDGFFTFTLLATNLAEAELKEFVKANHLGADTIRAQMNVVLVNTGDRRVLIDAGRGGSPQPTTGHLAANLQAAGIEPTAIDLVVLTHAHPDHLWGAVDTKAGTMRFPNARYVISDVEWDFWSDPERHGSIPERSRGMVPGTQSAFKLIADRTTRIKSGTESSRELRRWRATATRLGWALPFNWRRKTAS